MKKLKFQKLQHIEKTITTEKLIAKSKLKKIKGGFIVETAEGI